MPEKIQHETTDGCAGLARGTAYTVGVLSGAVDVQGSSGMDGFLLLRPISEQSDLLRKDDPGHHHMHDICAYRALFELSSGSDLLSLGRRAANQ